MTIDQVVQIAKRIHDAEGYDLGARSTRDYRNAFWSRVIGCVYHGHSTYNPTPDRQWHLKDGGGGRPQSDDVAVSMPSRMFWDCIGGVGADGYVFGATGHGEPLPTNQNVYAPPVPSGSGTTPPPPPVVVAYKGDAYYIQALGVPLANDYAEAGQAMNEGTAVWFSRTFHDVFAGDETGRKLTMDASIAKRRPEWRAALGLPPL